MSDRGRDIEIQIDSEETPERQDDKAVAEPGDDGPATKRRDDERAAKRRGGKETTDDASRLADELGRTQIRTTEEGYVEARVTALERVDDETVRLVTELPAGGTVAFRLQTPVPWTREFLLARLVEHVGYDAATVDHLVGERVLVQRGDPWDDDGRGVWEEGASESVAGSYRNVISAFGLDDLIESRPRWRLVDPAEIDREPSRTPRLSTLGKLLLATGLVAVCLLALPIIAILTPLSGGAVAALSALLFVLYVGVVASLVVRRLAG